MPRSSIARVKRETPPCARLPVSAPGGRFCSPATTSCQRHDPWLTWLRSVASSAGAWGRDLLLDEWRWCQLWVAGLSRIGADDTATESSLQLVDTCREFHWMDATAPLSHVQLVTGFDAYAWEGQPDAGTLSSEPSGPKHNSAQQHVRAQAKASHGQSVLAGGHFALQPSYQRSCEQPSLGGRSRQSPGRSPGWASLAMKLALAQAKQDRKGFKRRPRHRGKSSRS